MDINLIKKLIKLVENSEVTDLEVEENGIKIKVAKKVRVSQLPVQNFQAASPVTQALPVESKETVVSVHKEEEISAGYHEIKSPIVGTFTEHPLLMQILMSRLEIQLLPVLCFASLNA